MEAHIRELEQALAAQTARSEELERFVGAVQRAHPRQCCADAECKVCSVLACPLHEPLHFHHDGCPACGPDPEIDVAHPAEPIRRGTVYALTNRRQQLDGAPQRGTNRSTRPRHAQSARRSHKSLAGHHALSAVGLVSEHEAAQQEKETPR